MEFETLVENLGNFTQLVRDAIDTASYADTNLRVELIYAFGSESNIPPEVGEFLTLYEDFSNAEDYTDLELLEEYLAQ